MSALRHPERGCPWDLKQDHQSLAKYLREETAEVLEALAAHRPGDEATERHLREELGDLWLQVVFHAQMAADRGAWDLAEVERTAVEKLVRRHPHIFAELQVEGADEVLVNWDAIKAEERQEKGLPAEKRLLEGTSRLSALDEAMEIGHRCAKVGFEWRHLDDVLDKVREEVEELQAESDAQRVFEEFGDVLFSLVQWARRKGIDPDAALRAQMVRFRKRFETVEDDAAAHGGFEHRTLEEMDAAWVRAKRKG
jgi:MazG family protein